MDKSNSWFMFILKMKKTAAQRKLRVGPKKLPKVALTFPNAFNEGVGVHIQSERKESKDGTHSKWNRARKIYRCAPNPPRLENVEHGEKKAATSPDRQF